MKVLTQRDVEKAVQLERTTIWRMRAAGEFPKPFSRNRRGDLGWFEEDIRDWLNSRRFDF